MQTHTRIITLNVQHRQLGEENTLVFGASLKYLN